MWAREREGKGGEEGWVWGRGGSREDGGGEGSGGGVGSLPSDS